MVCLHPDQVLASLSVLTSVRLLHPWEVAAPWGRLMVQSMAKLGSDHVVFESQEAGNLSEAI